jgi:hypothetical protein
MQSSARTITIGTRSPFGTYGTMPAGPGYWWPAAQPAAFLDYAADVSALLDGDTIIAASLEVSPAGDGELIAAFLNVDGCLVSWWGWGGIAGKNYTVRLTLQTAGHRTIPVTIGLGIDRLLASYPLPPAPIAGFGRPLVWSVGDPMFGPVQQLPAVTVMATGTTQLTAAPIPLAKVLVNAGSGGVLLPQSSCFQGATMPVYNRSGGPITIYPHAGDTIESNGANAGQTIQDETTAHFSVAQSGLLILS